jgi:hypothetical protein
MGQVVIDFDEEKKVITKINVTTSTHPINVATILMQTAIQALNKIKVVDSESKGGNGNDKIIKPRIIISASALKKGLGKEK